MKEYKITVNFEDNTIETDLKKLVQNDYNSIKINFEIDKEYDSALFELKYPDKKTTHQMMIKDNEVILPKGILNQEGDYEFEISIYNADSKLTHFITKTFEVREELVKDSEDIANDDRYPVLSDLINETTKLKNDFNETINNVDAFKTEIKNDENLRGPKGETFKYEDFTSEQLEALRGPQGIRGEKGDTGEQGPQGASYDDTQLRQKISNIEGHLFFDVKAHIEKSENIKLVVKSNVELNAQEGFTSSEDNKTLTKVLESNSAGEVTVTNSLYGTKTVSYEAAPNLTVNISNKNEDGSYSKTNKVEVTIVSDKELQEIEGWTLSEDMKTLSQFAYKTGTNKVTAYDLAGNTAEVTYKIYNVSTVPPKIKSGSLAITYSSSTGLATIRTSYANILIDIDTNEEWNNASSLGVFTKPYTIEELSKGITMTLRLEDDYGNVGKELVTLKYTNGKFSATHEFINDIDPANSHTMGEWEYLDSENEIRHCIDEECLDNYEETRPHNIKTTSKTIIDETNGHKHIKESTKYCTSCSHKFPTTRSQLNTITNSYEADGHYEVCDMCNYKQKVGEHNLGAVQQELVGTADCCYKEYQTCSICSEKVYGNTITAHTKGEPNSTGLVYCDICGVKLGREKPTSA